MDKKKVIVAGMFLLGLETGYAQEQFRKDSTSFLGSLGRKAYSVLEHAVNGSAQYIGDWLYESELESQIENKMHFAVPDSTSSALLSYLGLRQGKSVDLTGIKDGRASAEVSYTYDLDGLAFVQLYEFRISHGSIDTLLDKRDGWIEIDGSKHAVPEGYRILNFYDKLIRDWDQQKAMHESSNPEEQFVYSRANLKVIGNTATADISYHVTDKFGQPNGGKFQRTTLEYVFSNGKWQFNDTNFFSSIKNPPSDEMPVHERLYNALMSGIKKIPALWRGE